jgi:benzoyl-CoA reductase/2-hydroxyglutaryl-CoA dehydratase subunit BcrC/BadD/HgdB
MQDEEKEKLLQKIQKLEKEVKLARAMIDELADENEMLWQHLDELKEMEIGEVQEAQKKIFENFMKSTKTVGDA